MDSTIRHSSTPLLTGQPGVSSSQQADKKTAATPAQETKTDQQSSTLDNVSNTREQTPPGSPDPTRASAAVNLQRETARRITGGTAGTQETARKEEGKPADQPQEQATAAKPQGTGASHTQGQARENTAVTRQQETSAPQQKAATPKEQEMRDTLQWFEGKGKTPVDPTLAKMMGESPDLKQYLKSKGLDPDAAQKETDRNNEAETKDHKPGTPGTGGPQGGNQTGGFKLISEKSNDNKYNPKKTTEFTMDGKRYVMEEQFDSTNDKLSRKVCTEYRADGTKVVRDMFYQYGKPCICTTTDYNKSGAPVFEVSNHLDEKTGEITRSTRTPIERKTYTSGSTYDEKKTSETFDYKDGQLKSLKVGSLSDKYSMRMDTDYNGKTTVTEEKYRSEGDILGKDYKRLTDSVQRTYEKGNLTSVLTTSDVESGGKHQKTGVEENYQNGKRVQKKEVTFEENGYTRAGEKVENYDANGNLVSSGYTKFGKLGEKYQGPTEAQLVDAKTGEVLYSLETGTTAQGKPVGTERTRKFANGKLAEETEKKLSYDGYTATTTDKKTTTYHPNGNKATLSEESTGTYLGDKSRNETYFENGALKTRRVEDRTTDYRMSVEYGQNGSREHCFLNKKNADGTKLDISSSRNAISVNGSGSLTLDEAKAVFQGTKDMEHFSEALGREKPTEVKIFSVDGKSTATFTAGDRTYIQTLNPGDKAFETRTGDEKNYKSTLLRTTYDSTSTINSTVEKGQVTHQEEKTKRTYGSEEVSTKTFKDGQLMTLDSTATGGQGKTTRSYRRTGDAAKETVTTYNNRGAVSRQENTEHDYKNHSEVTTATDYGTNGATTRRVVTTRTDNDGDGKHDRMVVEDKTNQFVTVLIDHNKDGKFSFGDYNSKSEVVERFQYHDAKVRRDEINSWNVWGKRGYYDNMINYLGDSNAVLNQHVEKRFNGDSAFTVCTFKNPGKDNVEISYFYNDRDYSSRDKDVREQYKDLNSRRPDFATIKTSKPDGTTVEKTVFPGTDDNYITKVNTKEGAWEKTITETHLMDPRNKPEGKAHMVVTEHTSDNAKTRDISAKLREFGYQDMPPAFEEFSRKAGNGKVTVSVREEVDKKNNTVKRQLLAVNPETGDQFVMMEEGGKKGTYFKTKDEQKEIIDMGSSSIHRDGNKYEATEREKGVIKHKESWVEDPRFLTSSAAKGTRWTNNLINDVQRLRDGGAINLMTAGSEFASPGIPSRVANTMFKNTNFSGFKDINMLTPVLNGLSLASTSIDLLQGKDIGFKGYVGIAQDVHGMAEGVSQLNSVRNMVLRASGSSSGAMKTLSVTGKTLGFVGAGLSAINAGYDFFVEKDYISGGINTACAVGTTIGLIWGSTGWFGPAGWTVATLATAGSIVYSNVKQDEIHNIGTSPLEQQYNMMGSLE